MAGVHVSELDRDAELEAGRELGVVWTVFLRELCLPSVPVVVSGVAFATPRATV